MRFGTIPVLVVSFGFLAGAGSGFGSDEILHERVFGPELPDPYKHPACFTELANGDLYLVYYGGSGEYGL